MSASGPRGKRRSWSRAADYATEYLSMTHNQVPSLCRRATSAVTLPSGRWVDVSANSPQTTAGPLISGGEFPARRGELLEKPSNGLPADRQAPVAAVEHRIRLIQRCHAVHVARPLARDQQTLQILRIAVRLPGRLHRSSTHSPSLTSSASVSTRWSGTINSNADMAVSPRY